MCVIDKILFDYKKIRIQPNDTLTTLYLPAVKKLNLIMDEADSPQATATCIILSSYSLQKWAEKSRNEIEIFEKRNEGLGTVEEIHNLLVEIYDVPRKMNLPEHSKSLVLTKEILDLVETSIDEVRRFPNGGDKMYEIMERIHLNPNFEEHPITRNDLTRWYKRAVELIISRFGDKFSKTFEEIIMKLAERDEEKQIAYHNTFLLLEAYPIFKWSSSVQIDIDNLKTAEANSIARQLFVVKLVDEAIERIKDYPDEGHICANIIEAIITDKKADDVCSEHNVSRSFYYRARKKAILLLSYLIWGYTTRDILNLAI